MKFCGNNHNTQLDFGLFHTHTKFHVFNPPYFGELKRKEIVSVVL